MTVYLYNLISMIMIYETIYVEAFKAMGAPQIIQVMDDHDFVLHQPW